MSVVRTYVHTATTQPTNALKIRYAYGRFRLAQGSQVTYVYELRTHMHSLAMRVFSLFFYSSSTFGASALKKTLVEQ